MGTILTLSQRITNQTIAYLALPKDSEEAQLILSTALTGIEVATALNEADRLLADPMRERS